jgi:hypothetical protein
MRYGVVRPLFQLLPVTIGVQSPVWWSSETRSTLSLVRIRARPWTSHSFATGSLHVMS